MSADMCADERPETVLVLGLGNRLMQDDAIGVMVVGALAQKPQAGVRYCVGETDLEYCLDLALAATHVIVVDAAVTGRPPGEVTAWSLTETWGGHLGVSQHDHHLLDVLHMYEPTKQGLLVGVEPEQIDYGLGLSRVLQDRLAEITTKVGAIITAYIDTIPLRSI